MGVLSDDVTFRARQREPQLGLRRVNWVRVTATDEGPVCLVAGIGHRRPVVRLIPLRTATALVASGVPLLQPTASRYLLKV